MNAGACKYLAPRRYVPPELKGSMIGSLDETSAMTLAYLIKHKMQGSRPSRIVLVDIDRAVYACRPDTASIDLLVILHPEVMVGVYDPHADVADIAGDLETMRRAWM